MSVALDFGQDWHCQSVQAIRQAKNKDTHIRACLDSASRGNGESAAGCFILAYQPDGRRTEIAMGGGILRKLSASFEEPITYHGE